MHSWILYFPFASRYLKHDNIEVHSDKHSVNIEKSFLCYKKKETSAAPTFKTYNFCSKSTFQFQSSMLADIFFYFIYYIVDFNCYFLATRWLGHCKEKKVLITNQIYTTVLSLYIAFISEQKRVNGKRVFLTRKTAASFIGDWRDSLETINEECSENKGCSYEEVLESRIPDVVSISNVMSCYQE